MRRLTEEITGFLKDAGFECSVQMRHGLEVVCTVTLDGHHDRVILPLEIEGGTPSEAEKQAAILKADGEAQAILAVQKAMADSLEMLNQKAPNDQVIKLKSIEAMQKIADGKATKIIIPSEMQGLVGLANGIVEGTRE